MRDTTYRIAKAAACNQLEEWLNNGRGDFNEPTLARVLCCGDSADSTGLESKDATLWGYKYADACGSNSLEQPADS